HVLARLLLPLGLEGREDRLAVRLARRRVAGERQRPRFGALGSSRLGDRGFGGGRGGGLGAVTGGEREESEQERHGEILGSSRGKATPVPGGRCPVNTGTYEISAPV